MKYRTLKAKDIRPDVYEFRRTPSSKVWIKGEGFGTEITQNDIDSGREYRVPIIHHNPKGIDESLVPDGFRFFLSEDLGKIDKPYRVRRWYPGELKWSGDYSTPASANCIHWNYITDAPYPWDQKPEPVNPPDFPTNLPKLPDAPEGCKWVYRGLGWRGDTSNFIAIKHRDDRFNWVKIDYAGGAPDLHYAEAVKIELLEENLVFTKKYQQKLREEWFKKWFVREYWNGKFWDEDGDSNWWGRGKFYRRKLTPKLTQEEMDNQAASRFVHSRSTPATEEQAFLAGVAHARKENGNG